MRRFIFDTLLDAPNICDREQESKTLLDGVLKGRRFVVYGRRNTGKTSVLKSILIPGFQLAATTPPPLVIFADLLGVKTTKDIDTRLRLAFQSGYRDAFLVRATTNEALGWIKRLRPKFGIDPTQGTIELTVGTEAGAPDVSFRQILDTLGDLHREKARCILVLDEFQDIATSADAQALLRDALQNLPASLPVVLLGSKKHLLAGLFAAPGAPLAGYGEDLEFGPIDYDKYTDYMNERFGDVGIQIGNEESRILQDELQRIPESINIVCANLYDHLAQAMPVVSPRVITRTEVASAIQRVLELRGSRFEEYLSHFSSAEEGLLAALAKHEPVAEPTSKAFLKETGLSGGGVAKAISRLLDDAVIYREKTGYVLGDPLLAAYLRRYR